MDNEGLRNFKLHWGAQEEIIDYYKYDLRQNIFMTEEALVKDSHQRVFRRIPIPLLKVIGTLYRR